MAMNPVDRAEYARHRRRRRRQMLGAVLCVLIAVGVGTVFYGGYRAVAAVFDDTDERLDYESRLRTLVMYDPLPFENLEKADPVLLREACIWGAIYNAKLSQGNLDNYETEAETGCLILPTVEVDAFASTLMGPFYTLTHEDFESDGMIYSYSEEKQGYLIPVTSEAGRYTPKVTKLHKEGRNMRVTVGYVPQFDPSDQFSLTAPTEPVKYMDYIFTRSDKQFYLTALEESQTKASESAVQNAPETDLDVDFDPNVALKENMDEDLLKETTSSSDPVDADSAADADSAQAQSADTQAQSAEADSSDEE